MLGEHGRHVHNGKRIAALPFRHAPRTAAGGCVPVSIAARTAAPEKRRDVCGNTPWGRPRQTPASLCSANNMYVHVNVKRCAAAPAKTAKSSASRKTPFKQAICVPRDLGVCTSASDGVGCACCSCCLEICVLLCPLPRLVARLGWSVSHVPLALASRSLLCARLCGMSLVG